MYTGVIRAIALYGAEIYPDGMDISLLEYDALRKCTGAYKGSSYEKLLQIAGLEPVRVYFPDLVPPNDSILSQIYASLTVHTHITYYLSARNSVIPSPFIIM